MKTEHILLLGAAAYLVLQSQKKTASNPVTPIPNATPTTTPNNPQQVLDQIVAIGNQVWGAITAGSDTTPVFSSTQVGTTAVGNSFDPADPGSNRMIAPMSYRPGAGAVSSRGVSVGVPGTAGTPTPTTRVKAPSGVVPFSPFALS